MLLLELELLFLIVRCSFILNSIPEFLGFQNQNKKGNVNKLNNKKYLNGSDEYLT